MRKWALVFFLALMGVAAVPAAHLLYLYYHSNFKPPDFYCDWNLTPKTSPSVLFKKDAKKILDQKFFYLGHGKQMTAYESEDHQYVIKFFNPRPVIREKKWRKLETWRRLSSLKWASNAYLKRKQRITRLFQRYQLAFEELPEETGLLYVHFGKETRLSQKLNLADKTGKLYRIDMDRAPFILQRRSELVTNRLTRLLQNGEVDKAKQNLEELYLFFFHRAKKGFTDRIQTVHNNYGFVRDKVIQIDLGRLEKKESIRLSPEKETERIHRKISQSLSKRYPELALFIQELSERQHEQIRL